MHIINYSLCKTLGLFFLLNSFYCMDALAQNGVGVNTNTPKSSFEDNGSFGKKVTTINAATTLDETYSTVVCNNLTTAITVTLPVANTCSARIYEIKRNAASTALVTINVTSGGTIDGVTSFLLSKAGQSITIFSDGSTWISRDGSGDGSNWALTGNAGTTAGTNFLGTTDVQDLVFKTNGSEGARLTSATPSAFGVGTTTPITYGRLAVVSNSVGSGRQDDLGIASFNASPSPSLLFFSAKGTEGAQTDLAAGDDIFSIIGKGRIIGATSVNTTTSSIISEYRGTGVAPNSNLSNIGFFTSGSLVAQMMLNEFGKVGIRTTGPVSYLEIAGSFGKEVTTITASTTLSDIHSTVICNNLAVAITVTLPAANTCARRIYEIKRNAASTALVTIAATIDGVVNYSLSYANQSITVFSDGTNWLSRDGAGEATNWRLTGNAGTTIGNNFLGTTDSIDFAIRTKNIERIRVTALGNVGIGNVKPLEKLHVSGNVQVGDSIGPAATGNRLEFSKHYNNSDPVAIYRVNTAFDNTTMRFELGDNGNTGSTVGQDFFDFCTYNTYAAPAVRIITSSGNVGINSLVPTSRLHVVGSDAKTADYAGTMLANLATTATPTVGATKKGLEITSTGTWTGTNNSNIGLHVSAVTGGTNNYDAIFNGGGNVGIGIAAPTEYLHIFNNTAPFVLLESNGGGGKIMAYKIRPWSGMPANTYVGFGAIDDAASSARAAIFVPNAANTGVTEAISILKSSGNVGIGTTNPLSDLEVNGSFAANINTVTTSPTLTADNHIVAVTVGTVTLPAANTAAKRIYHIANKTGGAITIGNYQNMFNATVNSIPTANTNIKVVSDGVNWIQF